jgi:hypothetical protein
MSSDSPPECLSTGSWLLLLAAMTFVAAGLWLARDALLELIESYGHHRFVEWCRSHPLPFTIAWRVIPGCMVLGVIMLKLTGTMMCA